MIEYGFTIPDNRYDFVRIKDITKEQILQVIKNELSGKGHDGQVVEDTESIMKNLEKYKMKDRIRIDLKVSGVHRDLIRLIRACLN